MSVGRRPSEPVGRASVQTYDKQCIRTNNAHLRRPRGPSHEQTPLPVPVLFINISALAGSMLLSMACALDCADAGQCRRQPHSASAASCRSPCHCPIPRRSPCWTTPSLRRRRRGGLVGSLARSKDDIREQDIPYLRVCRAIIPRERGVLVAAIRGLRDEDSVHHANRRRSAGQRHQHHALFGHCAAVGIDAGVGRAGGALALWPA